jgi:chromosome segregation ATPase
MNAMLREILGVSMIERDAVEAHLSYVRRNLDDVKTDVRELRADVKRLDTKIDAKIDSLDARFSAKLEKVTEELGSIRGMQKAMVWVIGVFGSIITVAISIAAARHVV